MKDNKLNTSRENKYIGRGCVEVENAENENNFQQFFF